MGCGASVEAGAKGQQAPLQFVEDAACVGDEKEAELLSSILQVAPTVVGPQTPSLGPPCLSLIQNVSLDQLPDIIQDLNAGMSNDIRAAPMRLLLIEVVLAGWPSLKVYEDVEAEAHLDVPYREVEEQVWRQLLVISWRWGAQKPQQRPSPEFSPMLTEQFRELRSVLQMAKNSGLRYVWIDWCCVPQYSGDAMIEVLRSRAFYARAQSMVIIPTFEPLPPDGIVRPLLDRCLRLLRRQQEQQQPEQSNCVGMPRMAAVVAVLRAILAKEMVAGRQYFSRVWTLAERMARWGRREPLHCWLSLEAWVGMVVDTLLKSTEDLRVSQVYRKLLGARSAGLLSAVMGPLSTAVQNASMHKVEETNLVEKVADLLTACVSIWAASSPTLEEAPTLAWLQGYLSEIDVGVYEAWSDADRVWAVHSYFVRSAKKPLEEAIKDLVQLVPADEQQRIYDVVAKRLLGLAGRAQPAAKTLTVTGEAQLASCGDDKLVRLWDATGKCVGTLTGHLSKVQGVDWSRDGLYLASGSEDETVRVWSSSSGACVLKLEGHTWPVFGVGWSPVDDGLLASSSNDCTVRLWDLRDPTGGGGGRGSSSSGGKCMGQLTGHDRGVQCLAWSPSGKQLATGSCDQTVRIWSADTGACSRKLVAHTDNVRGVAWSTDGKHLASASADRTVRVWKPARAIANCVHTLKGHASGLWCVCWSPNSKLLASGGGDHTVRIWDATRGACVLVLTGHSSYVRSMSWSAVDGVRLATGSGDGTVKVWDVVNGACVQTLHGHMGGVNCVAWRMRA